MVTSFKSNLQIRKASKETTNLALDNELVLVHILSSHNALCAQ